MAYQEDATYTLLKPRLSRDKLLEYRQKWTTDKEANRKIRFQTESRIAGNAAAGKFLTNNLRVLPGTPKSMEVYRERAVERYGIFAMSALKLHIGIDPLAIGEFRARIRNIGVDIKPYELSQVSNKISPLNFVICAPAQSKDLVAQYHILLVLTYYFFF